MCLTTACAVAITAVASVAWIDGDTIRNPWGGENLRLVTSWGPFDTPETWRPECPEERALGERATARAEALTDNGARVILTGKGCGYDRPCAVVEYPAEIAGERIWRDVGQTLIAEDLAKRSRNAEWCE
jgi:endonuclease YncB( thermonuclease family)